MSTARGEATEPAAASRVFIGLGSNLGEREAMLRGAAAALAEIPGVRLVASSSLYETEPWGLREQPLFLNLVIEVATTLSPPMLFARLREIEERLGRERGRRWGPRSIDLDLLLWENVVLAEGDLILPHSALGARRFVLVPLAELDPEVREPLRGRTAREMLASCPDRGLVVCLGPFAALQGEPGVGAP